MRRPCLTWAHSGYSAAMASRVGFESRNSAHVAWHGKTRVVEVSEHRHGDKSLELANAAIQAFAAGADLKSVRLLVRVGSLDALRKLAAPPPGSAGESRGSEDAEALVPSVAPALAAATSSAMTAADPGCTEALALPGAAGTPSAVAVSAEGEVEAVGTAKAAYQCVAWSCSANRVHL
jgi:hypothetical protein